MDSFRWIIHQILAKRRVVQLSYCLIFEKKQTATQFDSAETSDVKFDPVGPATATVVVSAAGSRQHGWGAI